MIPTVLVVDDNPAVATAIEVLLSLHDIRTLSARSPDEAVLRLGRDPVDLVIQDMNFSLDTTSGVEGAELFRAIRARHPDLPVILLTAWTHLETAVELIKAGAADYLAKPWDNQRLVTSVRNLLELGQASRELAGVRAAERARRDDLDEKFDLQGMVFADPLTERTVSLACQVARADMPVLITGPNGAGKERIAAIIQANSAVRGGPFVTLNCGALPSELIEAELFGAEPGAYTGATRAREGKFEAADGGTLFLDEIGNLSAAAQMKLLRVLETGRFQRLGSNKEQQVKVRVISATNADLPAMIRAGQFREDLYYRLNVINLAVPPLADRPRDILPLAEHFLPAGKRLGAEAQAALLRHRWPGNVRELRNVMQRAALLGGDVIQPADVGLVDEAAPAMTTVSGAPVDGELDRETIEAALARAGGVVSQAASELGLSRQALYRRMERLGIGR
ncbi:MAG TPA: sigma-54 dependent transcriptional regulator [Kofleriaceae bacterium]|nr:sigma-54 dependent transcriptional regulator [Kofleriaceae bacterium]